MSANEIKIGQIITTKDEFKGELLRMAKAPINGAEVYILKADKAIEDETYNRNYYSKENEITYFCYLGEIEKAEDR